MVAKTLYHALTADRDVPLTEAEQKKRVQDSEIVQVKKAREFHDQQWINALSDPKAFGKLMGIPSILGEPEPLVVQTAAEKKEELRRMDAASTEGMASFLEGLTRRG